MCISHEQRLLFKDSVKDLRRLVSGLPGTLMQGEPLLDRRELLLIDRIVLRKMPDEGRLVALRPASNKCGDCGNTDAATKIAREVEKAGGVSNLFRSKCPHSRGG